MSLTQARTPQLQLDPPEANRNWSLSEPPLVDRPAEEHSEVNWDEQDNLAQIFRHSGWHDDRVRVYDALKATMQPVSRIINFASCGFGSYVLKSQDEPPRYRVAGSKCHDRFCIPCASERSRTITANVLDRLGKDPVRMMTLTIGGVGQPLQERLDHLDQSFAKLRRTSFWRKYVTGGVAFLEIKWSAATDRWHPHLHCLVEGKYIPKRELSIEWQLATGDSSIVRLGLVRNHHRALHEVTKYASKPLSATFVRIPERLQEAIRVLYGRRLCTTFGRWRGVALTPHPSEDAWENLGSLHDMVNAAASGDLEAINVLANLNESAAATAICVARERSPPHLVDAPAREQQLTLAAYDWMSQQWHPTQPVTTT